MSMGGIDFGGTAGAQAAVGTTYISAPGQPAGRAAGGPGAPGANGIASNIQVHQAAMWLIFGSLAGLVVIGYVFRRGPIES
jgi:hypothetical protein